MNIGNFRVLIFIDLLATALGGSIILMLVISSGKKQVTPPAGKPRSYVFYSVSVADRNARVKLFVKSPSSNSGWIKSNFYDNTLKGESIFIDEESEIGEQGDIKIKMWGPSYRYGDDRSYYNVYATNSKKEEWIFGVLYYDNALLSSNPNQIINREIDIEHSFSTNDTSMTEFKQAKLSLGNFSHIVINVK